MPPFVGPKSGKCRGRAQLPESCLLTARDLQRLNETAFSPGPIGGSLGKQGLGSQAQNLCNIKQLSISSSELQRMGKQGQRPLDIARSDSDLADTRGQHRQLIFPGGICPDNCQRMLGTAKSFFNVAAEGMYPAVA